MPVKWTTERDQTLLILVLQLTQGAIDYRSISENWPESAGERPTPKALTEHIARIRKGLPDSPQKAKGATSTTVSPTKNKVTKSRAKKTKKVVEEDDEEEGDQDEQQMEVEDKDVQKVKKKLFGQEIGVKVEDEQEETI